MSSDRLTELISQEDPTVNIKLLERIGKGNYGAVHKVYIHFLTISISISVDTYNFFFFFKKGN